MHHDSLEKFSHQIADWAGELLEHGRYPFRKVSIRPEVITPSGVTRPDLVLWINRPSGMAGGVLFFPQKDPAAQWQLYADTAQSLGLSFFTTWDSQAIEIRQAAPPYSLEQRLSIEAPHSPAVFRNALGTLLEKLKPLSVTGALAPPQLSAWYIANLCRATLQNALPEMQESMRGLRNDLSTPPEERALNRCWHTLFHLLTLACFDLLPETVHAERLGRALQIATDALPAHLRESCTCLDPAPLPEGVAVSFHLLFRRLVQVGWNKSRSRMLKTVELLLDLTYNLPLNEETKSNGNHLLICEPRYFLQSESCTLLATPGRLPGLTLHRELKGLKPAPAAVTTPFTLPHESHGLFDGVSGHLLVTSCAFGPTLDDPLMHLRISWPNRRFRTPRQTPPWMLGFLHILGMCTPDAAIELITPTDWPRTAPGLFLSELLCSDFTLEELRLEPSGVRLRLRKSPPESPVVKLQLGEFEREVEAEWLRHNPATALPLALYLPREVWVLLQSGDLSFQPANELPDTLLQGLNLFLSSSWGKALLHASGLQAPRSGSSDALLKTAEWLPLPPKALIELLAGPELADLSSPQRQERTERELAQWFSVSPPATNGASSRPQRPKRLSQLSRKTLIDEVFIDGIPRFPEHYLFDHYRPELKVYRLEGTLHFQRRFFNQIELVSDGEQQLTADSDIEAHALILASHAGSASLELPRNEEILEDIVSRYCADLEKLWATLMDRCNRNAETTEQARQLARAIWRQQELPPVEILVRDF